jgi:hypothetical protein
MVRRQPSLIRLAACIRSPLVRFLACWLPRGQPKAGDSFGGRERVLVGLGATHPRAVCRYSGAVMQPAVAYVRVSRARRGGPVLV